MVIMNAFAVKLETFEGPLDLLLSLVEKRKLFINDISLAAIADDYLGYVQSLERYPIKDTAQFILVASTLVLIKSRSLLPSIALTEEEQGSIEDLEERLRQYQKIKELAVHVKERFGAAPAYAREESRNVTVVFAPTAALTLKRIAEGVKSVIANLPRPETIPQAVVRKMVSLEDMIGRLTTRIQASLSLSFKEFAGVGKAEKANVIITFLALLELVKRGVISARQEDGGDDIQLESEAPAVPHYS